MKKTKVAAGKSIVRDSGGRFVEGNKEGRKFQKGYSGKPAFFKISSFLQTYVLA
jgi:hypothetical protein